jgi:glycosyltransferase involved in cell wall biosynthesis
MQTMVSNKRMRILLLSPFFEPNIGGVETHLTDLTKCLRKSGHMVYVVTYAPLTTKSGNVPFKEKLLNLEVYRIKWIGRELFLKFEPYFLLQFLYLFPPLFIYTFIFMLRHKVDVVHAHGLIASSIAGPLSKLFKVRTVMSIHGIFNFKQRFLLRTLAKLTLAPLDLILALSENSKRDLMDAGIPENKIAICTHWVDQELFKSPEDYLEVRRRMGFLEKDFAVLFVGRLLESKGVGVLLKAAEKCPTDVKFLFIGTGPMEGMIREVSERSDNVKLVGKVLVETLADYYGAVDLVAVPSQSDEGFARVVLEALSCGTPVIAANKGCLPEMIDESVGVLLNPDPDHLYEQIMFFYENREALENLAIDCRGYAEKRYSERNVELILKAYIG